MRKFLLAALLVAFLSSRAFASSTVIMADSFDTGGTSTTLEPHNHAPTLFGDSHIDLQILQSYNLNNNEVAYFHFPYPSQQVDGANVQYRLQYESAEQNAPALFHCLRASMCVAHDLSAWYGSALVPTSDWHSAMPISGNNYNIEFGGEISSPAVRIPFCHDPSTFCTQALCAGENVRGVIYRLDTAPGCDAPSQAGIRIRSIEVLHNR